MPDRYPLGQFEIPVGAYHGPDRDNVVPLQWRSDVVPCGAYPLGVFPSESGAVYITWPQKLPCVGAGAGIIGNTVWGILVVVTQLLLSAVHKLLGMTGMTMLGPAVAVPLVASAGLMSWRVPPPGIWMVPTNVCACAARPIVRPAKTSRVFLKVAFMVVLSFSVKNFEWQNL